MATKFVFNALTGNFDLVNTGLTQDTRANILALTPTAGLQAYATDYEEYYIADGTSWFQSAIAFKARAGGTDMGVEQDSSPQGYGTDYVTDKRLSNVLIGSNVRTENGAIKVDVGNTPDTFEIYLRDQWNTILYDFTYAYNDLRSTPLTELIKVWSGNSATLGLNGLPVVQEYEVDMGAYPAPRVINTGTF